MDFTHGQRPQEHRRWQSLAPGNSEATGTFTEPAGQTCLVSSPATPSAVTLHGHCLFMVPQAGGCCSPSLLAHCFPCSHTFFRTHCKWLPLQEAFMGKQALLSISYRFLKTGGWVGPPSLLPETFRLGLAGPGWGLKMCISDKLPALQLLWDFTSRTTALGLPWW